jgi:hypothetical protein
MSHNYSKSIFQIILMNGISDFVISLLLFFGLETNLLGNLVKLNSPWFYLFLITYGVILIVKINSKYYSFRISGYEFFYKLLTLTMIIKSLFVRMINLNETNLIFLFLLIIWWVFMSLDKKHY